MLKAKFIDKISEVMQEYDDFIVSKSTSIISSGFDISKKELNKNLYEFQKDIVRWALKMDRRSLGIELKETYFNQAKLNLETLEEEKAKIKLEQPSLFEGMEAKIYDN